LTLDDLARDLHALEPSDSSPFRRWARVLQSLWREERGYPCGEYRGRPLGSLLAMPWAEEALANYLTPGIRSVVRRELAAARQEGGERLFAEPRIYDNLLSSQPLCFNLFAELQRDLPLATRLVHALTAGRFAAVEAVEFEYSPGRSDPRYTGDRSAFDVFLRCRTARGGAGFIGIEVKYHENLQAKPGEHRARYDEVAAAMGCFRAGCAPLLRAQPLQQIWRDHLLMGALQAAEGYDDALYALLYPADNTDCRAAVEKYCECLAEVDSFAAWTLEEVVGALGDAGAAYWVELLRDRYLAFEKIKARLVDRMPGHSG
jgi:hypothetical protein